jgi:hypothetical protein
VGRISLRRIQSRKNNLRKTSKLENMKNIEIKQTQQLLEELDALIEKDYQEALALIEMFKQETFEFREANLQKSQEIMSSLEIQNNFDNFESVNSDSYVEI